jgi:hypothetical protein
MKIRSMETFKVPPRWLFLKITTEDGIVAGASHCRRPRRHVQAPCRK